MDKLRRPLQIGNTDCGIFVLHFWEGEVKRFLGFGWCLPYPSSSAHKAEAGQIKWRRQRMERLVQRVCQYRDRREVEVAKHTASAGEAAVALASPLPGVGGQELQEDLRIFPELPQRPCTASSSRSRRSRRRTTGAT